MKNKEVRKKLGVKVIAVTACMALTMSVLAGCGSKDAEIENTSAQMQEKESGVLEAVLDKQINRSTDSDIDKEESVYVLADAGGNTTQIIVSEWLKNTEGSETLEDISDLKDIVNLKGEETYSQNGNKLIWNANGSDIHYQGTTDKEIPVDIKVTYYLDGEETSPEKIAGKSGNVKIRFDYSNRESTSIEIDGKEENIQIPFTVLSAMILPGDTFSNVEVTNGKILHEGDNNIVIGLGFPGLKDSLKLEDSILGDEIDLTIPEYVEVSAYAEDFSLDMTMSVVLSDVLSEVDLTEDIDLTEITDSLDELTDASIQLVDGSKELKDGVTTLLEKSGEFGDGIDTLNNGIITYTDGVASLSNGITEYTDGVAALGDGIDTLKNGTSSLNSGAQQLAAGTLSAKNGVDLLIAGYEGTDETPGAVDGARKLSSGLEQCCKSVKDGLNTGLQQLSVMTGLDTSALTKAKCAELATLASKSPAQVPINDQYLNMLASKMTGTASLTNMEDEEYNLSRKTKKKADVVEEEEKTEEIEEEEDADDIETDEGTDDTENEGNIDNNADSSDAGDAAEDDSGENAGEDRDEDNIVEDVSNTGNMTDNNASGDVTENEIMQSETTQIGTTENATDAITIEKATDNAADKEITKDTTNKGDAGDFEKYVSVTIADLPNAQYQAVGFAAVAQIGTLATSLTSMYDLQDALLMLDTGADSLSSGIGQLYSGTIELQKGLGELNAGADTLYGGTEQLNSGAEQLQTGALTLTTASGTLKDGASELTDASTALREGSNALTDGKGQLMAGIKELEDGAVTLNDGMIRFDDEGISKITEGFGDSIDDVEAFTDRLNAIMNAGNNYSTFTGLSEGKKGNVKFIIKTDAVK